MASMGSARVRIAAERRWSPGHSSSFLCFMRCRDTPKQRGGIRRHHSSFQMFIISLSLIKDPWATFDSLPKQKCSTFNVDELRILFLRDKFIIFVVTYNICFVNSTLFP
jgi:hypothetical protein